MLIGSRQRFAGIDSEPIINTEVKNIRRVSKTKSLGILIDENLNWNDQIDNISKKASKGLVFEGELKNTSHSNLF